MSFGPAHGLSSIQGQWGLSVNAHVTANPHAHLNSMASFVRFFSPISGRFLGTPLNSSYRASPCIWHKGFGRCSVRRSSSQDTSTGEKVVLHIVNQDGMKTTTQVTEGESLLDVVINKNLDISGFGACEGTLACSTCHLIFDENIYNNLGPIMDEEMDMLDLAYGQTKTSRLGCQVNIQRWMDGMTVHVPQEIKDRRNE
ncbi:ferredoxin 1b isoform X2 [Brienomyrus brachyistius]|uniref:ferredoxin 1b isoform X2 n=1 Tax=Brienomyrus brachyistius TaxID=42636 RepID=UPI0020B2109C|nr:ferredoxin 1b isoform X2 [Brienomyrus brachyistius]